jgi:hypothetical protein
MMIWIAFEMKLSWPNLGNVHDVTCRTDKNRDFPQLGYPVLDEMRVWNLIQIRLQRYRYTKLIGELF